MEHYELRLLCDYLHTGAQAADTWARPTPLSVNGELEQDERGEVVYAEIWSPVEPTGDDDEALKKVIIVADGAELNKYQSLSGIRETVMAPPKTRMWAGKLFSFGTPRSNNPLLNTTIKYKQNITVNTLCGPAKGTPPESPISQDYRIRLWGYVYKESEIPSVFGTMQFPAYLIDRTRGRTLTLNKNPIPVNGATWLTLPGGKDQSIPKINSFIRYAQNAVATDGMQGDYQLRYQTGDVLESDENMYFEFDELDALLIEGLGIKSGGASFPAANLARCGLKIAGDYHPKGPTTRVALYPTTPGINELNFGQLFPYAPASYPFYAAVPKLDRPLLIWNEIGMVVIRDDGVGVVAADATCVALTGIRIEMRG